MAFSPNIKRYYLYLQMQHYCIIKITTIIFFINMYKINLHTLVLQWLGKLSQYTFSHPRKYNIFEQRQNQYIFCSVKCMLIKKEEKT